MYIYTILQCINPEMNKKFHVFMPVSKGFLSMISWVPLTKMAPFYRKISICFDWKMWKNYKKCKKLLHVSKKS